MSKYSHQLSETEVNYYVVTLADIPQITTNDYGNVITVIDDQERTYDVRISKSAARIDGLAAWYHRYNPNIGQTINLEIINPTIIKLYL